MDLNTRFEKVAVLGAAGKMGSGIALLLTHELAQLKLQNKDKSYVIHLIDVNENALSGLLGYLRTQLVKLAEKGCVGLRKLYQDRQDLVENGEIIEAFVTDALALLRPSTTLEALAGSRLIFEAIIEDAKIKTSVLTKVKALCPDDTYFLTNTSSIPISVLDEGVGLDGRIVGYHFYNPPAVQKLLELITSAKTRPELRELGQEIAQRLRKKVIPANDIAGFIGNGHFMRDILHATSEVKRLAAGELSEPEAIYLMNKVSQDLLIRPMGIFQLTDYVGVEVCQLIMKVMTEHLGGETLQDDLLDRMVQKGVIGGQNPDGSQKDGFLKYEKGRPAGIYDLSRGAYISLTEGDFAKQLDDKLGPPPEGHAPWRALLADPQKGDKLAAYFKHLKAADTLGAQLARSYLTRSQEIAKKLVSDGVAASDADVNGVLESGFYHLYGPINPWA